MDTEKPKISKQTPWSVLLRQAPIVEVPHESRVPLVTEIPVPPDTTGFRSKKNPRKFEKGTAQGIRLTDEQIHLALSYRLIGRWSYPQLAFYFRVSLPTVQYKLGLYAKKTGYWKALLEAALRGKGVVRTNVEGPLPTRVENLMATVHPDIQRPVPLFQGTDNSEVLATKAEAAIDKALTLMNSEGIVNKMSPTLLLSVIKELVPIMQLLRGKATQNITKHTLAQRISIIYEKRVKALAPRLHKAKDPEIQDAEVISGEG